MMFFGFFFNLVLMAPGSNAMSLNDAPVYAANNTNSGNMHRRLQPSESSVWIPFKKINNY